MLVRLIEKAKHGVYAYASVRNQRTDFPVLACAAANVSGTYRISVGARPGRAICITDEEGFHHRRNHGRACKTVCKMGRDKNPDAGNHGAVQHTAHALQVRFAIG